jgi:hypothetical protein
VNKTPHMWSLRPSARAQSSHCCYGPTGCLGLGAQGYSDHHGICLASDILSLGKLSGVGNELLILQRCTLSGIADRVDALLRPVGHAHTAAHAGAVIDAGKSVIYGDRPRLA